jgi:cysteine desulfuration protein SufE
MSTDSIADRQNAIVAEFEKISDWQERYRRIIQLGRDLAPMDESLHTDRNKVKGCQSQVWLHATLAGDRIVFTGDSDASIVKGLVALVIGAYSGQRPADIIAVPPDFIDRIGLSDNLSQTRASGLAAMIKQVKLYAIAFDALLKQRPQA